MANCIYCGEPVGFLRNKHKECQSLFEQGNQKIIEEVTNYFETDAKIESIEHQISNISYTNHIPEKDQTSIIITGIFKELNLIINQNILDIAKFRKLFEFIKKYDLENELGNVGVYKNFLYLVIDHLSNYVSEKIFLDDVTKIGEELNALMEQLNLDSKLKNDVLYRSFEKTVNKSLEDNIITQEEEETIIKFVKYANLSMDTLYNNIVYSRFVKSLVLRDILNGILPKRLTVSNELPFILQKNESLIWLMNDIDYYEDKIRRQYTGGYQGLSLKVANGVYYRTGGFKGHPVETVEKIYLGSGILGFTNKQLYFFNDKQSLRIRYDKIISIQPNSNGFTILKDNATAKPQTFLGGDGWFSYNLITNLSQLDIK